MDARREEIAEAAKMEIEECTRHLQVLPIVHTQELGRTERRLILARVALEAMEAPTAARMFPDSDPDGCKTDAVRSVELIRRPTGGKE